VNEVEAIIAEGKEEEEALGDIPDEFLGLCL
jgi:hypothetical protein